jgi:hypothetical protein
MGNSFGLLPNGVVVVAAVGVLACAAAADAFWPLNVTSTPRVARMLRFAEEFWRQVPACGAAVA